jgi:DNA repair protein RadC
MVLFLDNQNRLIAHETLFTGTINHTQVHPREVLKAVLKRNAAAVILAHNHPSGLAEPSKADRCITTRLQQGLALIDVCILDHLVIGGMDSENVTCPIR